MTLVLDIATCKIKQNAILPTFEITLRAKHQENRDAFFTSAICKIYLGEETKTYLTSVPTFINAQVKGQDNLRFEIDLIFTQELMYMVKRQTIEGHDIHLSIDVVAQLFYTEKIDTSNKIAQGGWASDSCKVDIDISDWVKNVTKRSDYMLIPISPETHEKLQTLLKFYKPMKNLEDIIIELIDLNTKPAQTTEQG